MSKDRGEKNPSGVQCIEVIQSGNHSPLADAKYKKPFARATHLGDLQSVEGLDVLELWDAVVLTWLHVSQPQLSVVVEPTAVHLCE